MPEPIHPLPRRALTRAFVGLFRLTVQDAWGQRIMPLSLGVATAALALATSLSEVSIFAHTRLVVDVTLTVSTLFIALFTVTHGQRLVHHDLTVTSPSVVMARPLPWGLWLGARFAGVWAMACLLTVVMGTVTWCGMHLFGFSPPAAMGPALALIPCEVGILLACGMVFSCLGQPRIATVAIIAWAAAGYMAHDIVAAWAARAGALRPQLAAVAHVVLPELERLSGRMAAAHAQPVTGQDLATAWVYAVGYVGVWLLGSAAILRWRRA